MRSLIYIPIVHSEVDMGSMAGDIRRNFQRTFGADGWERRIATVEAMWNGIREKLLTSSIVWKKTRIYQDGLPVCGKEVEIVSDLAAKGSRNHQILQELMERGSVLMGTEDAELLVRDYQRIQKLIQAARGVKPKSLIESLISEGEEILHKRDVFIAERIETTLAEGETGILFVGLLHRVDELIQGNFEVEHVIHNLPFSVDFWQRLKKGHDGSN